MVRSHSFACILVSLLSLTLSAPLQADITPDGDVDPADYSWWTGGGDSSTTAYIGNTAAGSVTVNLGSDLSSWYGLIGFLSSSTGVVTVDGSGSTWTNSDSLYVGFSGHGTLNITNGGAVSNSYSGYIGYGSGSTGVVTVDGSGSTWTNSSDRYHYFCVGRDGHGTLNITNGGAVSNTINGLIGSCSGSTGVVTVDGSGSTWTNSGNLRVGYEGQGTLNITNGGAVSNSSGCIGYLTGSAGVVTVDGSGSTWTNSKSLNVGYYGHGTLNITNGGAVSNYYDYGYIGRYSGSTGEVTVDGSGSTWTNSGYLRVGYHGQGTLHITNGGAVSNSYCYIGRKAGSTGEVTVDGSDSTWANGGCLYVGYEGQGTLHITNGGTVSNSDCYIGYEAGSTGEVTVDGSGSTWTNRSNLYVGHSDQGTLNITNGGTVSVSSDTWVARNDGAAGEIHFDDSTLTTGGLLTGTSDLTGTGTINTHGLVSDVDLLFDSAHGLNKTLMFNSQPDQNITINLIQDSTGVLGAGYAGNGMLSIRDGVSVESSAGYIGYKAGATGVVTVDDNSSTWTNGGKLYVGYYGQGTLNITNGGAVSNSGAYIGYKAGSTSMVTVDGNGSTWICDGYLDVGCSGQGTLNITNGGTVSNNFFSSIGRKADSTGEVTVDGSGSIWTSSSALSIGGYGQGTLHITNGGAVSNPRGYIGRYSGSTGEVTVDGSGSTWTNHWSLYVGDEGQGTLNITVGGLVSVAETLTIDFDEDGNGFINMATGGMLALNGDADDSLTDFLNLIDGTDAIRYWDGSSWADITGAIYGRDYTLTYQIEGDLAGYTMLTVPEPATMLLLALGGLAMLKRRR